MSNPIVRIVVFPFVLVAYLVVVLALMFWEAFNEMWGLIADQFPRTSTPSNSWYCAPGQIGHEWGGFDPNLAGTMCLRCGYQR